MTAFENKIRDYLAENLSILDPGLKLIKKEFCLSSSHGAGGRIDILGQDPYGNYVIIELKRSDQSARQALHELFKYMSIIYRQLGVSQTKIRAMLVSTTWHELTVPFSEYLVSTPFHTEGYEIDVDADGTIVSAVRFQPTSLSGPLEISQCQSLYLYEEPEGRNENASRISECLTELSIGDHVLLFIDYRGQDVSVVYPYGTYVLFSSPFHTLTREQRTTLKNELDWDDELDEPEENFLVALTHNFNGHDTLEIGYPEKLRTITESWSVKVAIRAGRFKSNEGLVSDDSIILTAMQAEGGSTHSARCIVSPRFEGRWQKAIDDVSLVVRGNSLWSMASPLLLEEIAAKDKNACVAIGIYNLADTIFALSKLCIYDLRFFPTLEIISKESDGVRIFWSNAVWSQKLMDFSAKNFFKSICSDPAYWLSARHFGAQYEFDDIARMKSGLSTPIWEMWIPADGESTLQEINYDEGAIMRKSIDSVPSHGLDKLLHSNVGFFSDFRGLLSKMASGLFDYPKSRS